MGYFGEVKRFAKNVARKQGFSAAANEDFYQDVFERVWKFRHASIVNGSVHYGYVEDIITTVIAEQRKAYLKNTNYLKCQEYAEKKRLKGTAEEQPKPHDLEVPLPHMDVLDNHYGGQWVNPMVLGGEMDFLGYEQDPVDEIQAEQLLLHCKTVRISKSESKGGGIRESVRELLLSGMTDGQDIAAELHLEQKPVSQAKSYVIKMMREELEALLNR
ncbi:hypothetical protein [Thiocapsa rosea]|uniref:Uncharacterized protein n=1 Tax=Thiocapsa rosea TaxID=69360 RepID=A0A495UNJ9_9GAMM|nr:hypothetical protein [Thiocapsa rosea]RKT37873.1 hypothetical protein BDD21_5384 [Thiocapsa rosea]